MSKKHDELSTVEDHCHHGGCHCGHGKKGRRRARKLLGLLALTDVALKAVSLHEAVKRDDKGWVLPLALLNTAGVLPIYYLVSHAKR